MEQRKSRNHWLSDIMKSISDKDLCETVKEISEFRDTGILPTSAKLLAKYNSQVASVCKVSISETMRMTEDAVLFEASRRFYNQTNSEAKSYLHHAKWVTQDPAGYYSHGELRYCTSCWEEHKPTEYCPSCGAVMDL